MLGLIHWIWGQIMQMQNNAGWENVNQRMTGTESNYHTLNMVMFEMMK
jgi:hypothetical protein